MIPVASRASTIEYAIRDVVVPSTKLEAEGHEIIKLNIGDQLPIRTSNTNTYG